VALCPRSSPAGDARRSRPSSRPSGPERHARRPGWRCRRGWLRRKQRGYVLPRVIRDKISRQQGSTEINPQVGQCAPRARGDGTRGPDRLKVDRVCSPRARGWSRGGGGPAGRRRVLPACVGMVSGPGKVRSTSQRRGQARIRCLSDPMPGCRRTGCVPEPKTRHSARVIALDRTTVTACAITAPARTPNAPRHPSGSLGPHRFRPGPGPDVGCVPPGRRC
jgi:hypothetical protein